MLGVAFASNFSKRRSSSGFNNHFGPGNQQRVQAAFFSGVFSVMGYISKVDGKVSKSEIILAQQVMQHMQLSEDMIKVAKDLFNQGKQADFNLDEVLEQFRLETHRRTHLIRMFLETKSKRLMPMVFLTRVNTAHLKILLKSCASHFTN